MVFLWNPHFKPQNGYPRKRHMQIAQIGLFCHVCDTNILFLEINLFDITKSHKGILSTSSDEPIWAVVSRLPVPGITLSHLDSANLAVDTGSRARCMRGGGGGQGGDRRYSAVLAMLVMLKEAGSCETRHFCPLLPRAYA